MPKYTPKIGGYTHKGGLENAWAALEYAERHDSRVLAQMKELAPHLGDYHTRVMLEIMLEFSQSVEHRQAAMRHIQQALEVVAAAKETDVLTGLQAQIDTLQRDYDQLKEWVQEIQRDRDFNELMK
jgi:hypothetical protein